MWQVTSKGIGPYSHWQADHTELLTSLGSTLSVGSNIVNVPQCLWRFVAGKPSSFKKRMSFRQPESLSHPNFLQGCHDFIFRAMIWPVIVNSDQLRQWALMSTWKMEGYETRHVPSYEVRSQGSKLCSRTPLANAKHGSDPASTKHGSNWERMFEWVVLPEVVHGSWQQWKPIIKSLNRVPAKLSLHQKRKSWDWLNLRPANVSNM